MTDHNRYVKATSANTKASSDPLRSAVSQIRALVDRHTETDAIARCHPLPTGLVPISQLGPLVAELEALASSSGRLVELARDTARRLHRKAVSERGSDCQLNLGGHVWRGGGDSYAGCDTCPHPDCALVRSIPASASPHPVGAFTCPVCGVETVHAHGDSDIFNWLDAQASRFGYRLVQRQWALRRDNDESLTNRVDHCLKRLDEADMQALAATPMGRRLAEVFRQVRPIVEQHEAIPASASPHPHGEAGRALVGLGAVIERLDKFSDQNDTIHLIVRDLQMLARALTCNGEEWQPIETAPKDRTVLLYGAYTSGALGLVQGAWNHGGAMHMPHWMGGIIRPTHWMPLPQPPSALPASLEEPQQP